MVSLHLIHVVREYVSHSNGALLPSLRDIVELFAFHVAGRSHSEGTVRMRFSRTTSSKSPKASTLPEVTPELGKRTKSSQVGQSAENYSSYEESCRDIHCCNLPLRWGAGTSL
jgi:hypothetical protein